MIAAIIPAAGQSRRMGQPKLILPIGGIPVIARVVIALRDGGADRIVVVAPPRTEPGATSLIEAAEAEGAEVVVPDHLTADMRASVELGLAHLDQGPEPTGLLLAPGDLPGLGRDAVRRVIAAGLESPDRIVVPRHQGRRGHPLLLPWSMAKRIAHLPPGVGVNALLADLAHAIREVAIEDPDLYDDLDTPNDYRRWS